MTETGSTGQESKIRVPLNEQLLQEEFQRQRQIIEKIIAEHKLSITPEEYWHMYKESIQFLDFDTYIQVIDKVIDQNGPSATLYCFYPDDGNEFEQEGEVINSDTFMIRLLQARIKDRNLKIKVEVINKEQIKNRRSVKRLTMIDDAIYGGGQKHAQLSQIPENVSVNLFTVGATVKGVDVITKALTQRKHRGSEVDDKFEFSTPLISLREKLTPEGRVLFKELYASNLMKEFDELPVGYSSEEGWKASLLKRAEEVLLDKPMVFTPFKLPDDTSTNNDFLRRIVPVQDRAYIPPENFFEYRSKKSEKRKLIDIKGIWKRVRDSL